MGVLTLARELEKANRQAFHSLLEGMEELLTLHRLGLQEDFSKSFRTTNCIENVNSQLRKYIGRVKRWNNSDQMHRWVVCGLIEAEAKMRKIDTFKILYSLKNKVIEETETKN